MKNTEIKKLKFKSSQAQLYVDAIEQDGLGDDMRLNERIWDVVTAFYKLDEYLVEAAGAETYDVEIERPESLDYHYELVYRVEWLYDDKLDGWEEFHDKYNAMKQARLHLDAGAIKAIVKIQVASVVDIETTVLTRTV